MLSQFVFSFSSLLFCPPPTPKCFAEAFCSQTKP